MQCHLSDRALRRSDRISDISLSQWIRIFSHKVAIIDIRSILFSISLPTLTTLTATSCQLQSFVWRIIKRGRKPVVHRGPGSNIMTDCGQYETIMMRYGWPNTKFSPSKRPLIASFLLSNWDLCFPVFQICLEITFSPWITEFFIRESKEYSPQYQWWTGCQRGQVDLI